MLVAPVTKLIKSMKPGSSLGKSSRDRNFAIMSVSVSVLSFLSFSIPLSISLSA